MRDIPVQCTRCRNRHMESERKKVRRKGSQIASDLVCPRCGCHSYYDMRPQIAWSFASGLIEFGDEGGAPEGSIVIAHGPKSSLKAVVSALAHQSHNGTTLLVPGIPEAPDRKAAVAALGAWLTTCASGNGRKPRHGVVFHGLEASQ